MARESRFKEEALGDPGACVPAAMLMQFEDATGIRRRGAMKRLALILTVSVAAASAARAEPFEIACARGEDARKIEVLEPGTVGEACDVRYARDDGANVSVPYRANHDVEFCAEKARELAGILADSGYSCAPVEPSSLTAAPAAPEPENGAPEPAAATAATEVAAQTPASAAVAQPAAEPQPAPASETAPDALAEKLNEVLEEAPQTSAPEAAPVSAAPAPEPAATAATEVAAQTPASAAVAQPAAEPQPAPASETAPDALAEKLNEVLEEAPQTSAPEAAPVSAAPAPEPAAQTSAEPARPAPEPVEKIVGAEPTPQPAVAAVTQPTPAAAPPAVSEKAASSPSKPRPVQEVIRATLAAQAAAWNEGDLEGFMQTYWNSDDLRFVSGTEVSKGWTQTLKRYRTRYGDGPMGRLGFRNMEVELVRHDVAVVVGRYDLQRGDVADSGLFTLVMKRINGAWRIVHDHTVADPKAAQ
ncbi:MAG: YybH family protein [Parvularculaceae bacterium]